MHYLVKQLGYLYMHYIKNRQEFHSYATLYDSKGNRTWIYYLGDQ